MAWIIENDRLTNDDFMDIPSKPFTGDAPLKVWKFQTGKNKGMPFIPLMMDRPSYNPVGGGTYYIGDTPVIALYFGDSAVNALL